ncbi:MAG: putative small protein [Hydrocarboniphaga sp.]|uniref:DUF2158 domain-containing protein n=1 Tax=Hydrocarboniphaga sp. TaxID=2033016 RepID=UPI0026087256|nr:DUF2158 domain-containing protein [Hydrocarboniphaga sp.]MDB5971242.1 putative small protein [Hydrocarboniphaga sp.]
MSSDIKVGDAVRLKTGGASMTVESIEGWKAVCVWRDNNKPYREPYPLLVLRADAGPAAETA